MRSRIPLIIIGIVVLSGIVAFLWTHTSQPVHDSSMTAAPIDSISEDTCRAAIKNQADYLSNETYSGQYIFSKYPTTEVAVDRLTGLDTTRPRSAAEFRTKLSEGLEEAGVNFNSHYSIVSVGMTGWGENHWIVDRSTGTAYEFPYKATYLDFHKDSNLIIMDSKEAIENALRELDEPLNACAHTGGPHRLTDLRPFYFVWEDEEVKVLAPNDIKPPLNTFWNDYFNES